MGDKLSNSYKYETFFWSQKEKGKNYVVIKRNDGTKELLSDDADESDLPERFSSFGHDKILSDNPEKYRISLRIYPLSYKSKYNIFIDGILNKKDSAGRFISYCFLYTSPDEITKESLTIISNELERCVEKVVNANFTTPRTFLEKSLDSLKNQSIIQKILNGTSPDRRSVKELMSTGEILPAVSSTPKPSPGKM